MRRMGGGAARRPERMLLVLAAVLGAVAARGDEPLAAGAEPVAAALAARGDRAAASAAVAALARRVAAGEEGARAALVRARYFLAAQFLPEGEAAAELETAVQEGLAGLGRALGQPLEGFDALDEARARLGREQVPLAYWTALAYGAWIPHLSVFSRLGAARRFRRVLERLVELDGGYFYAGPHRVLAEFLAQAPGIAGGDEQAARDHALRAVELAPGYIENHVVYAAVHHRERDPEAYREALRRAAAMPVDGVAAPDVPEQRAARARARRLLEQARP
ncbi:MAG: hypothetical protein KatS3mg102_2967 [Planctomycetota bacterium]|nr:MAG: hypothetical protein KatS3mg102_2967 [Planctomycetota bacterium]